MASGDRHLKGPFRKRLAFDVGKVDVIAIHTASQLAKVLADDRQIVGAGEMLSRLPETLHGDDAEGVHDRRFGRIGRRDEEGATAA